MSWVTAGWKSTNDWVMNLHQIASKIPFSAFVQHDWYLSATAELSLEHSSLLDASMEMLGFQIGGWLECLGGAFNRIVSLLRASREPRHGPCRLRAFRVHHDHCSWQYSGLTNSGAIIARSRMMILFQKGQRSYNC